MRRWLDALYTPQWAGGWWLSRWLWVLAALLEYGFDAYSIGEVWGAPDMVFTSGWYRMADLHTLTIPQAWGLWGGVMTGIAMVAFGGRWLRPGLVLWAVCAWTMLGYEALNVKAHDRLLLWWSVGLLVSPAHEARLWTKWRSPAARWYVMLVFASIYGSTGLNKALKEPTWWTTGEVLQNHFMEPDHGGFALGLFLSTQTWALPIMAIVTVVWEVVFPLLIWFKRFTPPLLVVGAMFHVILLLTMWVGPFAFVALAAYPVMLHPDYALVVYRWVARRCGWPDPEVDVD